MIHSSKLTIADGLITTHAWSGQYNLHSTMYRGVFIQYRSKLSIWNNKFCWWEPKGKTITSPEMMTPTCAIDDSIILSVFGDSITLTWAYHQKLQSEINNHIKTMYVYMWSILVCILNTQQLIQYWLRRILQANFKSKLIIQSSENKYTVKSQ